MVNNDSLRLVVLGSAKELGDDINREIQKLRGDNINRIIPVNEVMFKNGECKSALLESVRKKDVYIIGDPNNWGCTYSMYGFENHMSPQDHFNSFVRAISAVSGHAMSITVVMPFLYESRQHKRTGRESLDCAIALRTLENMGVRGILTIDAHDPGVQNAIPLLSFDNLYSTNVILEKFLVKEDIDYDNIIAISPDHGAISRTRYFADVLGCNIGMFIKRRDLTKVVNGTNPIKEHQYIGDSVKGKTVLVIDDMIASGDSILDVAQKLKKRGAKKIYLIATFSLFTNGIEVFKKAYKKGWFHKIYTTNATYVDPKAINEPWIERVNVAPYFAQVINNMNKGEAISPLISNKKIKKVK